ncbi:MAG: arginine--tRNA ligase [Leptolinea sp.]|jgi:arginyl-tRNA synthetase|nr:arginine--tRNA ligase [Leptolinea sp.]
MFQIEQSSVEKCVLGYFQKLELPITSVQWNWIPFSGHWGISMSFFQAAALEARAGKVENVARRASEMAEEVASQLFKPSGPPPSGFERVEAVKGYLNLYFSSFSYANRVINAVLSDGKQYGRGQRNHQRVMVEFSQPNTHKAFHVGHLRNVILGNAVCNILDAAGYDVIRTNYIGDIGLHVIKWMWNYVTYHKGEQPGEDRYRWMTDLYAEADRRYNDDPNAEPQVRALFARWDAHDPELLEIWEKTRQWSLEGFAQIYKTLDVKFDHFYYESEVEEPGKKFVERMIEMGIARDERPDGAVIVPLDDLAGTKEKYRVLVVLRSDGTSLYSTKDLSLAVKKFEMFHLDRSIYVVDVRQSLYLQQIYKTLELMGYDFAKKCHHLAYEIVNLPGNVTMSSRDGTVVLLEDLINEATSRALKIVQEKNPELSQENQQTVARAVALGAIKYSMVSRDNTKIVTFDWETALNFEGQAAPYIQYAFVRSNSILRKAGRQIPHETKVEYPLSAQEVQLIDLISRFNNELTRSAAEFKPMLIANYAFSLAQAFNDFYNTCPVISADEPVRDFRLRLTAAARQAISNSLSLLGIDSPEVM